MFSESVSPAVKHFVGIALLIPIYGVMAAVFLGTFLFPFAMFWGAARASDAKLEEEAGPAPGRLRIEDSGGPLAPASPPPRPSARFFLTSPAWLLSGLGLVGGAGIPPALYFNRGDLLWAFGSMFAMGIFGWLFKALGAPPEKGS